MPGRQVRHPHGRVGRVHALATGPGRAVDVDLELVRVDLDLDLLGLGHDRDGRRRRVDPPLRLGLRDALHAMRAALPLEDRVGAVALDREHDLLEAARLVRAHVELLDVEAPALRVARQHPEEVGGPERGLVAADALADLDDHVLAVGGVRLDERELAAPPRARRVAPRARARARAGRRRLGRPRGRRGPRATPAPACAAPRAPSGVGRPPPPRGGRCRRQGRTARSCVSRRSARPRRRVPRSPPVKRSGGGRGLPRHEMRTFPKKRGLSRSTVDSMKRISAPLEAGRMLRRMLDDGIPWLQANRIDA